MAFIAPSIQVHFSFLSAPSFSFGEHPADCELCDSDWKDSALGRNTVILNVALSVAHLLCSPDSSAGEESTCNAGDLGSIPGLGRSPREGKGYPLQYSGLVAKSWT